VLLRRHSTHNDTSAARALELAEVGSPLVRLLCAFAPPSACASLPAPSLTSVCFARPNLLLVGSVMHFKTFFLENRIPEWQTRYISYRKLNRLVGVLTKIRDSEELSGSDDQDLGDVLSRIVLGEDLVDSTLPAELHTFWRTMHEEIAKVNDFFSAKLKLFRLRFEVLEDQLVAMDTQVVGGG
jgi:hypothetical protein